jgi:hypothetical protein
MEPVSTLLVLTSVAVAATSRPRWEAPKIEAKTHLRTIIVNPQNAPTHVLGARSASAVNPLAFPTLKDRLLKELESFVPGNPGSDPGITSVVDDISTASEFLKRLPAGIPLPTLMRSDDGQIGMYWDSEDAYLDINIDSGRTLSLFSRLRSENKETFIDSIPIAAITPRWAFENLAMLSNSHAIAA